MARPLEKVSRQVRRALIREAGGKCANPGCASQRTNIHHIEYKIYSTNDPASLIAICPSCHDAVHHGELTIDDATIYRWKRLRHPEQSRGLIYVQPRGELRLLLGTIAITGPVGVRAFDLSPKHRLSFSVEDGDVMLLDLEIQANDGHDVIRLSKGHIRIVDGSVNVQQRAGHLKISSRLDERYLPGWVLDRVRRQEPDFGEDGRITLLEIEVLEPGLVRVEGIWVHGSRAVVITKQRLAFVWPDLHEPVSMVGEGRGSVLMYMGPISGALFGFGQQAPAALKLDSQ